MLLDVSSRRFNRFPADVTVCRHERFGGARKCRQRTTSTVSSARNQPARPDGRPPRTRAVESRALSLVQCSGSAQGHYWQRPRKHVEWSQVAAGSLPRYARARKENEPRGLPTARFAACSREADRLRSPDARGSASRRADGTPNDVPTSSMSQTPRRRAG